MSMLVFGKVVESSVTVYMGNQERGGVELPLEHFITKLSRIIPLCHSDLLFQCVFGLFIQDCIPLSVSIFFGLTKPSEFCSEPWFFVVVF